MRRALTAAAALLLAALPCLAQEIVIDPSQIAASATNAAEQVDYMLDQLGELAEMGDRLNTVKDHIDNVFGEDGAGGKTIAILNDLGTLERLTAAFNSTMERTDEYARMMEGMKRYRLSDANMLLMYLGEMKTQATLAVGTARKIIATLGWSKKEKKDGIEEIIAQMEADLERADDLVRIETETTLMAEGMYSLVQFLDESMTAGLYVESRKPYGSLPEAGRHTMGLLTVIIGLLGLVSAVYGTVVFLRDGIDGDATVDNVFLRIAAGTAGALVMIGLIASASGLDL